MSNTNQEKIKQAVDLLIDKDTDMSNFFAKDGMLKQLESSWKKKLESEQHQLATFNPIIKSIEESLKVTKDVLQSNLVNIKNQYELELAGLDSDYMDI